MAAQTYSGLQPRTNAWAVAKLLKNAQPEMHIQSIAGQNAQPLPENSTDTVIFRRYLPFDASVATLTEGTKTGNFVSSTYEDFSVTLVEYGSHTEISDKVELMHEDNVFNSALQRLGEQAGKMLETVGWNILKAATAVKYSGTATALNQIVAPLNLDNIRECVRYLENNDAEKITEIVAATPGFNTTPIAAAYFALIHTDLKKDLYNINAAATGKSDDFIPVHKYSSAMKAMDGEVGSVEDVRFLSSTLYKPQTGAGAASTAVKNTAGNADVYNVVFVARDAFSIVALKGAYAAKVMVSLNAATTADPYNSSRTLAWKVWYAVAITNPRNIVRLLCASAK